jgi:hypothetical protein
MSHEEHLLNELLLKEFEEDLESAVELLELETLHIEDLKRMIRSVQYSTKEKKFLNSILGSATVREYSKEIAVLDLFALRDFK